MLASRAHLEHSSHRVPVYEPTGHDFAPLSDKAIAECIAIERVELWSGSGDSAFLLRNFLSAAECDEIIAQAEGFGLEDCGYSNKIRVTDRVAAMGEELSVMLFERARPYLTDVLLPDRAPLPYGVPCDYLRGLWRPDGLNPCFRVCRYAPGGFFQPHHDGGFDVSDQMRSIKTFMIYLNDGFEGGPTTFYDETQPRYQSAVPEKAIYALKPERGSCLVFNQRITHDGGKLKSGTKYILRTEVMYRHCTRLGDDTDSDDSFVAEAQEIDESLL